MSNADATIDKLAYHCHTNGCCSSPANLETLPLWLHPKKACTEAEREKEDRRHALKRRMDEVDAAIDKRVYNLYGLTEDEIKAVEAGTQR